MSVYLVEAELLLLPSSELPFGALRRPILDRNFEQIHVGDRVSDLLFVLFGTQQLKSAGRLFGVHARPAWNFLRVALPNG